MADRRASLEAPTRRPAAKDPPEFCPNCSSSLSTLDQFCPACGTVLGAAEEE